jgi:hypothetical protein
MDPLEERVNELDDDNMKWWNDRNRTEKKPEFFDKVSRTSGQTTRESATSTSREEFPEFFSSNFEQFFQINTSILKFPEYSLLWYSRLKHIQNQK